ncbi:Metallo-dependent phosphatase [Polychaeton citri CBS 116435]|uniref:Metallo-dependent phosphatase n=1 Tax=Polychaeton citri CBS 116435 TaxID=1314669 RepID=A0A9P4QCA4_9PEZI|nr:Metallo-dependent phosphatase [Polychaeton citri CBS 116435]
MQSTTDCPKCTRVLVLSDTHGESSIESTELPQADIAIHCGDLTDESKLSEFHASLRLLESLPAPLELVIAGNHDFTLDNNTYQQKATEATTRLGIEPELLRRELGALFDADNARAAGIVLLDEGNHSFNLTNGAQLTVYASPLTPSASADWGFQYIPAYGDGEFDHAWDIREKTDIVITHSPPRGVLDHTDSRQKADSPSLLSAVAKMKPKLHCFGHIHEGWGARAVAWRPNEEMEGERAVSHFTAIDNDHSVTVKSLTTLKGGKLGTEEVASGKMRKAEEYLQKGYCEAKLPCGEQASSDGLDKTLLVNASIESRDPEGGQQLPWLVELNLPAHA